MSTCLTSVFSSECCRRHIQGQKLDTAQKIKFSIKDFSNKFEQICIFVDLVTFPREIFTGKFYFLCSVTCAYFLNSPKISEHDVIGKNVSPPRQIFFSVI